MLHGVTLSPLVLAKQQHSNKKVNNVEILKQIIAVVPFVDSFLPESSCLHFEFVC